MAPGQFTRTDLPAVTRREADTHKFQTPFGSMFVGIEYDDAGHVVGLEISPPQKLENTTVGELLDAIGPAVTAAIAERVNGAGR